MSQREPNGIESRCPIHELGVFAASGDAITVALHNLNTTSFHLSPGQMVYQSGTPAMAIYVLVHGYIKLSKTTGAGKAQIIRIVKAGELFGFDSLVAEHYNHSAITLGNARLCCIPVANLNALGEHRAEVERLVMVRCIKELQHADERLLELGAKRSAERLASFLLEWCAEATPETWTPLVLSRLEIAQLLGLTIETVSRLFAQWKRDKVVREHHQAILIEDKACLSALAQAQ